MLHWTEPLTRKLVGDVKMVGSFITCEGTPKGGEVAAEWRLNPYVLPHAWATDKVGGASTQPRRAVPSWFELQHTHAGHAVTRSLLLRRESMLLLQ